MSSPTFLPFAIWISPCLCTQLLLLTSNCLLPGFSWISSFSLFILLFSLSLCLPSALSYPLFPVLGQCLKYETETCLFSIGQNTTFKLPWALQCQHPGQHSPFNYEICNRGKKDKRNLSHLPQLPYHGLWVYLSKLCFANLVKFTH